MTLWPEYVEDFPLELFENFVLPAGKKRFEDMSLKELIFVGFMHQGRVNNFNPLLR